MVETTKAAAKAAAFLKQKKYRKEQDAFLVEGLRSVEEAVESGRVKTIFFVPTEDERTNALLRKVEEKGIELSKATVGYMLQMADTTTPQGIMAVCELPHTQLAEVFDTGKMVLVVDRVQDPGNLGTLIRTADAAGLGGVICLNGTADAYMPKVVRSAMGALFHVPVVTDVSETDFLTCVAQYGYQTVATAMEGGESVFDVQLPKKSALILGNEANGVSEHLLQSATERVFIPMQGRAESLNVAMAAAVIIFELNH